MEKKINRILISGGVHGNELTGINFVNQWKKKDLEQIYPSLYIDLLIANAKAVEYCRRYIDCDLNRSFSLKKLHNKELTDVHEQILAKELNENYGEKDTCYAPNLAIDIHNTTANMGISIIFSRKTSFLKKVISHLYCQNSDINIYYMPNDNSSFPTIAENDICLEIGPQPHGTINPDIYFKAEIIVQEILDFCVKWNNGEKFNNTCDVDLFTHHSEVKFPVDAKNNITAMLHPELQNKNYKEICVGDNLFVDFEGNTLPFQHSDDNERLYPVFVGEQAYYERRVAFNLTTKETVTW